VSRPASAASRSSSGSPADPRKRSTCLNTTVGRKTGSRIATPFGAQSRGAPARATAGALETGWLR
jgi:hypothetical protein